MYIEQNEIVEKELERIGREKGGGVRDRTMLFISSFYPPITKKKNNKS